MDRIAAILSLQSLIMKGVKQKKASKFTHMVTFSLAALTVGIVRGGIPPGTDTRVARCFTTLNCTRLGTEPVTFTTVSGCCLSEQGLAYNVPGTELCVECILYGWLSGDGSTVHVQEDGSGQQFQVGYIKPGTAAQPPTIQLTVEDTEGTARRGADYTVTDNDLIISQSNDSAMVTIRVDGIALEQDETFQLRLVANSPPAGVFCMDTLTVIIEDGNVVNIQLTEDNYRGNERDESIGIVVSKDARIATNVSLTVSPVVLAEARNLNLFPMNAVTPDDNMGRSPVEANLDDFDNTVLTVTFQADEVTPRNEIELRVPIADDAINEATEQDFVVILNLTSSVNPALTMLPRRSSLCRIIENDPIIIGFERQRNTFTEPMIEEDRVIYLIKQNNVTSEQIFIVSFQRTNNVPLGSGFAIAEDGVDYMGIPEEFTLLFTPNLQCLCLSITLLADGIPEPTEAFQIGSSSQSMPTFNNPDGLTLFSQTFVVIENDGSMPTFKSSDGITLYSDDDDRPTDQASTCIASATIAAVLCSLMFFFIGAITGGLVIHWSNICQQRKMKWKNNNQQLSSGPVYDEPSAVTMAKTHIEMETNAAYGGVAINHVVN